MRTMRCIAAATAIGLTAGAGARTCDAADVVVLRSGTMMEGEVVSLDEAELVLEIESGRSILERAEVRSIHFDTTAAALRDADGNERQDRAPGDEAEDRVFDFGDKETYDVGDAVEKGALRLRLSGVEVRRVRIVDLFGNETRTRDEHLVLEFDVWNVGPRRALEVRGHPVFGGRLVHVVNPEGEALPAATFGPGRRALGALEDDAKIAPGDEATHVEAFETPDAGAEDLTVVVDLSRFGGDGVVRWSLEGWARE